MRQIAVTALLLLFAFSSIASADVIYTYTGAPFDDIFSSWSDLFGAGPTPPSHITATVQVANPFPDTGFSPFGCGFVGSPIPGLLQGHLTGIISGVISDGARTISDNFLQDFDEITLGGCGTQITQWYLGAVFFSGGSSDFRDLVSFQLSDDNGGVVHGDRTLFPTVLSSDFQTILAEEYVASTSVPGQWTAVVTPEVNTGALALISGSLLLLGYRRRRPAAFRESAKGSSL